MRPLVVYDWHTKGEPILVAGKHVSHAPFPCRPGVDSPISASGSSPAGSSTFGSPFRDDDNPGPGPTACENDHSGDDGDDSDGDDDDVDGLPKLAKIGSGDLASSSNLTVARGAGSKSTEVKKKKSGQVSREASILDEVRKSVSDLLGM